jgi:hypothetical protein
MLGQSMQSERVIPVKSKTEVRELAPEKFWSGSIDISTISPEELETKIKEAAKELDFTYSGYLVSTGEDKRYVFSRYPRRAFGPVAPVERFQEALAKLSEKTGSKDAQEEQLSAEDNFRVLLGLEEGYAEYKKKTLVEEPVGDISLEDFKKAVLERLGDLKQFGINIDEITDIESIKKILQETPLGKKHSEQEVKGIIGTGFNTTQADIFTAGSWGTYTEPALIITGQRKNLDVIYKLAEEFKQARIAVEDLHKGESFMVETKYCEDPDKE